MPTNIKLSLLLLIVAACSSGKEEHAHEDKDHPTSKAVSYSDSINTGLIPKDTLKGSPVRTAMNYIGNNHVHIVYGSPGVKDRIIWGGLVAYDQVWVTGAHKATFIEFSKDIIIADKKIPAGKYAFFTIPGKEDWTLILNKSWDQHLADKYSAKEDVLRILVKPVLQENSTQRLTYSVEKSRDHEGRVVMKWEKIEVALPFLNAD